MLPKILQNFYGTEFVGVKIMEKKKSFQKKIRFGKKIFGEIFLFFENIFGVIFIFHSFYPYKFHLHHVKFRDCYINSFSRLSRSRVVVPFLGRGHLW